ncbi:MAG: hypothetical protein IPL46_35795 [Saprospiraceae bacterium]|nr:hypothetical protein [Saprospiraceae bacterium]
MINKHQLIALRLLLLSIVVMAVSCGQPVEARPDGAALSEEVCNCKMQTKGMKYTDPVRVKKWKECLDLQGRYYKTVSVDKEQLDIFQLGTRNV